MKHEISIRKAEKGDEALILSFIRELAEYERALNEVKANEDLLASTLIDANPRAFCDIAEWNKEPAGFALWFFNFSTWHGRHGLYLEDIYVRPQLRGHGIGKALMVHLAKRAIAEHCGRFEWAVLNWNTPSIEFYKSLGAEPMNDWTVFRLTGDMLAQLADA